MKLPPRSWLRLNNDSESQVAAQINPFDVSFLKLPDVFSLRCPEACEEALDVSANCPDSRLLSVGLARAEYILFLGGVFLRQVKFKDDCE